MNVFSQRWANMKTYLKKQKSRQYLQSAPTTARPSQAGTAQIGMASAILQLQRTIGNQSVQRLFETNGAVRAAILHASPSRNIAPNMNRKPVYAYIQRSPAPPTTSKVSIEGTFRLDLPKRLPKGDYRVALPQGLTATSYKWKIKTGAKHAKIVAGSNAAQMFLQGISNGRVTLEVEVGTQTQTHTAHFNVLVTSPGGLWVKWEKFNQFSAPVHGYKRRINYQLLNHEKGVLTGSGFLITEKMAFKNVVSQTQTTISVRMKNGVIGTFRKSNFRFGQEKTDSLGRFDDRLRIRSSRPLPNEMHLVIHQTIMADGIVVRKNELVYSKNNVSAKKI